MRLNRMSVIERRETDQGAPEPVHCRISGYESSWLSTPTESEDWLDYGTDLNVMSASVTYLLTATNNGPSGAANVVVSDTLPSDITSNVTAVTSVSGVTPAISNGQVTANLGTLAAGATATVTITVQPNAAAVPQISDSATITSDTFDSNTNNNSPPAVTTVVQASADLQVNIAATPNPVPAGQNVTYTITAANNGPSDATGVVVTDTIPSGVTFVSATGGITPDDNGKLTFTIGNLAANASTALTVVVATSGTTPTSTTDAATITSSEYDPNSSNNKATSLVPVTPVSNLSITMSGSPNPVYVGSNLTYTIVATNSGPSADPAAVVTDTLPASVNFVSATGGATASSGVVTLHLGNLAANASSTITIVVTPTAAAAASGTGTLTDSAVITGQYNSNLQNSSSVNITVNAETALNLHVTAAPDAALVGQDLTYTVTATDNGPSNATGVILTDTLPADITSNVIATTSVTGVTAAVADGQVTANFGDLNVNASVTLTITVVPTPAALANAPLVDTATITNNEFNPNPSTATSSVPVTPTITWSNPADITYDTALSATQLDATASVPGTFTYTPATGTVLNAGADQTLSVSFTPTDTTDYAAVAATVTINVDQATPTITWASPMNITYGIALSGTQLDASANVPGAFTYSPAVGAFVDAGSGQTLSATFTPNQGGQARLSVYTTSTRG